MLRTLRSSAAARSLRKVAYQAFYGMPAPIRRVLVRAVVGKYMVGAVALIRDADNPDRLLLLRQPPGVGWSIPAGLLKRGERPVDGCARELFEESGIRLSTEQLTPAVPNAIVHTHGRWVDMVFDASVPATSVTLATDGGEVIEAAWHRIDNLPPLTHPAARLLSHYGIGPYADYPEVRTR